MNTDHSSHTPTSASRGVSPPHQVQQHQRGGGHEYSLVVGPPTLVFELNTVFLKKKETPLYTRWRHRALQEAQAQAQAQAEAQTQTLGVFKSFSTACCGGARTMP